jgi:hypothetical protein
MRRNITDNERGSILGSRSDTVLVCILVVYRRLISVALMLLDLHRYPQQSILEDLDRVGITSCSGHAARKKIPKP